MYKIHPNHENSQPVVVCNFVEKQQILMPFSPLDFKMNGVCEGLSLIHLA